MCFGRKDNYDPSEEAAKRTDYPPPQPTYAPMPKTSAPQQDIYAAPPGPPPSQPSASGQAPITISELPADDYAAPPPGPPPSQAGKDKPKPEHDWESVVPDTALFPPPPDIFSGWDRSPTSNATEADAQAGMKWCQEHPLSLPSELDAAALGALEYHNIRLLANPPFRGNLAPAGSGVWECRTPSSAPDSCLLGYPPLYAVPYHSPLSTGRPATAYYEVKIRHDSPSEVTLALGFAALPYPSFRMPGWHRGSLAVHGDDGHKFINDMWGGKSFTEAFRRGDTYGLGMRFLPAGASGSRQIDVEVFFTRNGRVVGSWNLHEETDSKEDLPVTGLEGFHDLCCAVGTYKDVSFEVVFEPERWLYKDV